MSDLATIDPNTLLKHRAWVHRLAQRLLGDAHDAEDVVQRTWLAAMTHPPRAGSLRAWLAKVVRTTARDVGRRRRREAPGLESTRVDRAGGEPPAVDLVAMAETHRRLVECVLTLEEPYRTTILARFFDGQTPSEIAAASGTPASTVRVRLRRGLSQLRERCATEDPRWQSSLALLVLPRAEAVAVAAEPLAPVLSAFWPHGLLAAVLLVGFGWLGWSKSWGTAVQDAPDELAISDFVDRSESPAGVSSERRTKLDGRSASLQPSSTGRVTVRVTWSDGRVAAGVGIRCIAWGKPHAHSRGVDRRVNAKGAFVFAGLPVGRVGIYGDRGGSASVVVRAGGDHRVSLQIPRGIRIEGAVVDHLDRPVPHARLVITSSGNSTQGMEVGRADENGRFTLRDVGEQHYVAARAPGHAPARAVDIKGQPGDRQVVTLQLRTGGRFSGVVVDPRGVAVLGAHVRILPPNRAPTVSLETDDRGRFEVDGMCLGSVEVRVRAGDLAAWSRKIVVSTKSTPEIKVRLSLGATLHGVVRTKSGTAVAGALVMIGGYADFLGGMVRTDGKGRYELPGISAGEAKAGAQKRSLGSVAAKLRFDSGRRTEWNPILDAGRVVQGTLVDHEGQVLTGWLVNAFVVGKEEGMRGGYVTQSRTDTEGRFTLIRCPDALLNLIFSDPSETNRGYAGQLKGVRPGATVHRVQLQPRHKVIGSVRVRVEDYRGNPFVTNLATRASTVVRVIRAVRAGKDGVAVARRLIPNSYRFVLECGDLGLHDLGEHVVEAGKELNLGVVRLPQPGALTFELTGPKANWAGGQIEITRFNPWDSKKLYVRDLPAELHLMPAEYQVQVVGSNARPRRYVASPGERTHVVLAPAKQKPKPVQLAQTLQLVSPGAKAGTPTPAVDYEITSEDGGFRRSGKKAAGAGDLTMSLPAGRYRCLVLTQDGRCGRTRFELAATPGVRASPPIQVALVAAWAKDGDPVVFRATPAEGTNPATIDVGIGAMAKAGPVTIGRWTVEPDANGTFELKGRLAPGKYMAAFIGPDKTFARKVFTVEPGKPAQVEARLAARR